MKYQRQVIKIYKKRLSKTKISSQDPYIIIIVILIGSRSGLNYDFFFFFFFSKVEILHIDHLRDLIRVISNEDTNPF